MSGPQVVCCVCGGPCGIYSPVCTECTFAVITAPDPIAADEAEHGICALPMTPEEEAEQVNLRG